jgi:EmrB/QacA subfamily drug resistance transporter
MAEHGRTGWRRALILAICCMSLFLTGLDVTIVTVALPSIGRDLGAQVSGLQWTVAAYTVTLAALLLSSGTLADRVGRRRVFQVGLSVFAGASWLCSLASSLGWLIAFRVLQGAGASMLNPAALGIIANTFTTRTGRARAIGVWDGVFGLSMALGPVVGGALTGLAGWRAVFWPSIPVALAAAGLTAWFVPDSRAPRRRAADPAGQALVIVILGSLAYAIIEGPWNGWASPKTLCLFALAAGAAVILAVHGRRSAEPVISPGIFRQVPFSAATVTAICFTAATAGFLFLSTLYLQDVDGETPLHAGLALLPMPAAMTVCAPLAGRFVARHTARLPLLAGGAALALSGAAIALDGGAIAQDLGISSDASLALAYGLFGAGAGLCSPAITNTIMGGLPGEQAAVASSISSASRQLGQTLGTAVVGTVLLAGLHGSVHAGYAHASPAAWWVTVGFGAAIVPLALAAARHRTVLAVARHTSAARNGRAPLARPGSDLAASPGTRAPGAVHPQAGLPAGSSVGH